MNIYRSLNEITEFIDNNLGEEISYEVLSKMLGVNVYTMQRLFSMISGISISEYIRKRRLSMAGYDLYVEKLKVIDVAFKYQYDNATSFSRAFKNFHGIKPSLVNKKTKLKNFPRIVFNENVNYSTELDYEVISLGAFILYGIGISTNNDDISMDAPKFFMKVEGAYLKKYGDVKYGMIVYDSVREERKKYYCLYDKEIKSFEQIKFPKSKWLKFQINSCNAKDIQELSRKFYSEFLPSTKYRLRELPELEYYHDDVTDFLVAIY